MTDESNSIEIPEPKRRICGTLLMNLPPDQASAILDRMIHESDDGPSMCLVKWSGSEIVEPE